VDNRDANIDLLFRNSLKDFEVLPPVGIWDAILRVVRKKQKPFVMLRAAAIIAVILSVSALAYKWSTEITITLQGQDLSLGDESISPANMKPVLKTPGRKASKVAVKTQEIINTSLLAQAGDPTPANQEAINGAGTPLPWEPLLKSSNTYYIGNELPKIIRSGSSIPDYSSSGTAGLKEIPDIVQNDKSGKWSVSALVSPTYYLRPGLDNSTISKQISSSEQSRISYSGGISFAYRISRKFSIQSGLYYSSIGNEITGINSFSGFKSYDYTKGDHNFEVLTSNGLIYTDNADVFLADRTGDRVLTKYTNDVFDPAKANLSFVDNTLYQNFSYIEMPVFLRYKLIDKTFGFNVIGGLSYNLLVNNKVNAHIGSSNYVIGKTAGLNPFMVTSSFGMGMEYNLSNNISLSLEPTFRYYLNPFRVIQGPRTHPYSFGIFSGLSYRF
jgi:hypothetical protein